MMQRAPTRLLWPTQSPKPAIQSTPKWTPYCKNASAGIVDLPPARVKVGTAMGDGSQDNPRTITIQSKPAFRGVAIDMCEQKKMGHPHTLTDGASEAVNPATAMNATYQGHLYYFASVEKRSKIEAPPSEYASAANRNQDLGHRNGS